MTPAKGCCMDLHIYSFWGYKWTTWAFMGWVCTVRIVVSWSFMPHRNLKTNLAPDWIFFGVLGHDKKTQKNRGLHCMDLGIISFTIYNVKRETCAMFIFSGWAWTVRPFVRHGVSHTIGLHKLTAWKCHMMPAQNVAKICNEFHK